MTTPLKVIPTGPGEAWVRQALIDFWGSDRLVAHGTVFYPAEFPGFAAYLGDALAGLLTYRLEEDGCEILTLHSLVEGRGSGTALLDAVKQLARLEGCARLWLITTNDNLNALAFYQRRGFRLARLYPDSLAQARLLKPEIPQIGENGIPLRDEIELELSL